jgi:hypothetical protein
MLLLKACPRCHGDLVLEQDDTCGYLMCVQCGHILSAEQEHALGYRVTKLSLLHMCAGADTSQERRHVPRSHSASARKTHRNGSVHRKQLQHTVASVG